MTQEEDWLQPGRLHVSFSLQRLSSSDQYSNHHHLQNKDPPASLFLPLPAAQNLLVPSPHSSSSLSSSPSQHHQDHYYHHHYHQQQQQQKQFQHKLQHPKLNVVCVDTIITDSFGNTIRYDSQEDVGSFTQKGRRHSGPASSVHGVNFTSSSSSPNLGGGSGSSGGGCDGRLGVFDATTLLFNINKHDGKKVALNAGACSDGGGSGGRNNGSRPSLPTLSVTLAPKSAPNSRPSSPRPETKRGEEGKKGRTSRRHSTASVTTHGSLMMSQDAMAGGGGGGGGGGRVGPLLNVPTFSLDADSQSTPSSPHQTRTSSFRESKTPKNDLLRVDEVSLGQIRRNSMPNVSNNLLHVPGASFSMGSTGDLTEDESQGIRRVRSFKTTSKGIIVNRGDSFKKKSTHSLMSTGSTVTDGDARSGGGGRGGIGGGGVSNNGHLDYGSESARAAVAAGGPGYFRVCMMGAAGVGKTSMAHQFLTSEYVDHDDAEETSQMTVTVLLDGEESTIEFIDPPDRNVITEGVEQVLDAFVVVFAINDHDSFTTAQQLVRYLRVDYGTDRAILLVANKIDLVRKRKVTAAEARTVATTYDCKYAETSAALNHHVDELLVGIITQIRLQLSIPFTTILFPNKDPSSKHPKDKKTPSKGPKGFFSKLFRRGASRKGKKDKGVDNLMY